MFGSIKSFNPVPRFAQSYETGVGGFSVIPGGFVSMTCRWNRSFVTHTSRVDTYLAEEEVFLRTEADSGWHT